MPWLTMGEENGTKRNALQEDYLLGRKELSLRSCAEAALHKLKGLSRVKRRGPFFDRSS